MLRNYLAAALRNLIRNRMYSAINIAGLAVGLAAAILIAVFVRYELSYDAWIPGHERVYRISTDLAVASATGYAERTVGIPVEAAAWIGLEIPEAEAVSRHIRGQTSVRRDARESQESIAWVEPEFLSIVPLPVIAGDLSVPLAPGDAIITQRLARAFFQQEAPLGETLEIRRRHTLRIVAVIADFPQNTTLGADIITSTRASFSPTAVSDALPADQFRGFQFEPALIRLPEGADVQAVEARLREALKRRYPAEVQGAKISLAFNLVPMADVHLDPAFGGGGTATIKALSVIGALIAAVAIINFVNLMTARATRRAVEVGARKTAGASRPNLIAQFVGEGTVYVALATALALVLVETFLPTLNGFLQQDLRLEIAGAPLMIPAIIADIAAVGFLAGAYPAVVLSRLSPVAALKTEKTEGRSHVLRQGLVVCQFAILIALGLATGTIYLQTKYAMAQNMRLSKDQVLLIATSCSETFKREVAVLPGVRGAACSSATMTGAINGTPGELAGGNKVIMSRAAADYGLLELYDLKPLAGRFFSREIASDGADAYKAASDIQQPIVANEALVRGLGLASAEDAIGRQVIWINQPAHGLTPRASTIIGVVTDFATRSVSTPIEPMAFFIDPGQSQLLHVKLDGARIPETLEAIDSLWRTFGDDRPIRRFFFDQHVEGLYGEIARQGTLMAGFTATAVLIAVLGLFGLSAFAAEQRTKEIGIRKSMGATRIDILRLILWQFAKPVLWANVIAWPVSYFVMRRWLDGFAYRIDLAPWMFLAASGAALLIALATVIGHALLVARAQPVKALRYE